jgi:hypothetical protein
MPNDPLSFVPDPKRLPIADKETVNRVRPGSMLAVCGLFVEIIAARFTFETTGDELPWRINRAEPAKSTIWVASAYNEGDEMRNRRPAVVIEVENAVPGRIVTGDRAGQRLESGLEAFYSLLTMPITVDCIASKRAEAAVLGDAVQVFLHASSDLIQAAFGFHEMTPVSLSKPVPVKTDKTEFSAQVSFSVQVPLRWSSAPTHPLLRELVTRIVASSNVQELYQRAAGAIVPGESEI